MIGTPNSIVRMLMSADSTYGVGGAARNHWPHCGRRVADAHRATRIGLPRRRSHTGGDGHAVSALTHWDHEAGDVCVLWCVAIRRDRWIAAIPRPSATDWPSAATQSLGAAQRVATGRAGVGVVVDINGASAMVTGGAPGIGAASVRQLAARGARVIVADHAGGSRGRSCRGCRRHLRQRRRHEE